MTRRLALTPAQAAEIRAAHIPGKRGHGYGALAKRYNVGESTIRDLLKYWTGAYL
jgi:transposase